MIQEILDYRPVIAVFISMIAAGVILLRGNRISANRREAITFGAAVIKAVCIFSMVPQVLAGNEFDIILFEIAGGISLELKVDGAGMVFGCVASGLWILTSVYSIGYMRGHKEKNQTGYFAAFAMCLSGAIGICFAANLLTFFIFYEILTVATYPLVVHYRDKKRQIIGQEVLDLYSQQRTAVPGRHRVFVRIVWHLGFSARRVCGAFSLQRDDGIGLFPGNCGRSRQSRGYAAAQLAACSHGSADAGQCTASRGGSGEGGRFLRDSNRRLYFWA